MSSFNAETESKRKDPLAQSHSQFYNLNVKSSFSRMRSTHFVCWLFSAAASKLFGRTDLFVFISVIVNTCIYDVAYDREVNYAVIQPTLHWIKTHLGFDSVF